MWCDDPPEDPVISIFAGCLANHGRAHSREECVLLLFIIVVFFVYYESIKRELKKMHILECWSDSRLGQISSHSKDILFSITVE